MQEMSLRYRKRQHSCFLTTIVHIIVQEFHIEALVRLFRFKGYIEKFESEIVAKKRERQIKSYKGGEAFKKLLRD